MPRTYVWQCGVCGWSQHNDPDVCSSCNFIKGASKASAEMGMQTEDSRPPMGVMLKRLFWLALIGGPIWLVSVAMALATAIPYGGPTGGAGAIAFLVTLSLLIAALVIVVTGISGALRRKSS